MVTYRRLITTQFPPPGGDILRCLELLDVVQRGDPDELAEYGELTDLPRPWEPATCPAELRESIWMWIDAVVAWINREYAWKSTAMIPECWPLHPHIARELPVLAMLRWNAEESAEPAAMEEWNRYAYPMFCDRLGNRLSGASCRSIHFMPFSTVAQLFQTSALLAESWPPLAKEVSIAA